MNNKKTIGDIFSQLINNKNWTITVRFNEKGHPCKRKNCYVGMTIYSYQSKIIEGKQQGYLLVKENISPGYVAERMSLGGGTEVLSFNYE